MSQILHKVRDGLSSYHMQFFASLCPNEEFPLPKYMWVAMIGTNAIFPNEDDSIAIRKLVENSHTPCKYLDKEQFTPKLNELSNNHICM